MFLKSRHYHLFTEGTQSTEFLCSRSPLSILTWEIPWIEEPEVCLCLVASHVQLFATRGTVTCQAPLWFSRQEYWSGLLSPPARDLSNPRTEPRSLALQADSLPSESPGKPTNTGVGSLSCLQGSLLTQELNWGLLNCRQILYQLSYQERSGVGVCWDPWDHKESDTNDWQRKHTYSQQVIEAEFKPRPAHSQDYILYAALFYAMLLLAIIQDQNGRELVSMRKGKMS